MLVLRHLALFSGWSAVVALSLTVLGCEGGGEGTSVSASSTGGHGGETATGGTGTTGGGGASTQGGSGGEGGSGGSGGDAAPTLAQQLAGGVWHFEALGQDPFPPDAAWLRFELSGQSDGTVDELPDGSGAYFPCAGAGVFSTTDSGLLVKHPCDQQVWFELLTDGAGGELPPGALGSVALLVSQVTPMKGYKYPTQYCDEAMAVCGVN